MSAKDRFSAAEIARRNAAAGGKPLNTVMKTAATACELAHAPAAQKDKGGRGERDT
jgi:hypothetical protein